MIKNCASHFIVTEQGRQKQESTDAVAQRSLLKLAKHFEDLSRSNTSIDAMGRHNNLTYLANYSSQQILSDFGEVAN